MRSKLKFLKNYYQTKIHPNLIATWDEIRHPGNSPHMVSQSLAIGVFLAIFIPLGLQSISFALLLLVYRYNFIIANSISFISNPFTIIPIYYAGIHTGEFFLGEKFPWQYFNNLVENLRWDDLIKFDFQSVVILFAGLFILAVSASAATYIITLKTLNLFKNEKHNLQK